MSNYKVKLSVPTDAAVRQLDGEMYAIGGKFSLSEKISISGTPIVPEPTTTIKELNILLGNGEKVVATGTVGYSAPVSFSGAIVEWRIVEVSDPPISGTVEIDLWRSAYSNYPPTDQDSITGDELPNLTDQTINGSQDLLGWDTSISVNDCIGFSVIDSLDCKSLHLVISIAVGE